MAKSRPSEDGSLEGRSLEKDLGEFLAKLKDDTESIKTLLLQLGIDRSQGYETKNGAGWISIQSASSGEGRELNQLLIEMEGRKSLTISFPKPGIDPSLREGRLMLGCKQFNEKEAKWELGGSEEIQAALDEVLAVLRKEYKKRTDEEGNKDAENRGTQLNHLKGRLND